MIQKSESFLNEKNIKITKRAHAFKSFASCYNAETLSSFNSELKDTGSAIRSKPADSLPEIKSFKFVRKLVLVFKKIKSEGKIKYEIFYLSTKAEIVIDKCDINDEFQSIYTTIVIKHTNLLNKRKEFDHPRKCLINVHNTDDD